MQNLCFRILILLDHLSQDPVVALAQDLCMRILLGHLYHEHLYKISVSGFFTVSASSRTSCARSLYQDPSGPLYRDPFGPLYQDPNLRKISVSGSLCWDPFGPLVSRSCSSTGARSLSQDLCVRILLDHLYQDPVGPLLQDLCIRIHFNHLCKICSRICV